MLSRSLRRLSPGLLLGLAATVAPAQTPAPAGATAPATGAAMPQASLLQTKGPQAGFGDLLVLGTGGGFVLSPAAAGQVPVIDGAQVAVEALAGPWQPGRHAVSLESMPSAGGEAVVQPPLQFVYDPGPPKVQWEVGSTNLLDTHGLDQDVDRERPPRRVVPKGDKRVKVIWSPDGRRWLPLLPADTKPEAGGALAEWLTAADRPQVFLWALDQSVFGAGAPVQPQKLQLVRIWAADELSAVRDLKLRVLPSPSGGYLLEMLATDLVGNATSVTWPLAG